MEISIVVPAIGGRKRHLEAMMSRLTLNRTMYPEVPFEVIIIDGSGKNEYEELSGFISQYIPTKYVSLPIGKFINAAYPRNVGFRIAQGKIITMLDVDYWVSENLIDGIMEPYKKGLQCLNRGYVIDTNKSEYCNVMGNEAAININETLLSPVGLEKEILDIYPACKIPSPKPPDKVWLWAAPRDDVIKINGYDEQYCQKYSYTREDDSMFYRLACILPQYSDSYNKFCCLHLYHPAAQRDAAANEHNKRYYEKEQANSFRPLVRNIGKQWGRLIKGAYSIINNERKDEKSHELWIKNNVPDVYAYDNDPYWDSIDSFVSSLD